MERLVTGSYGTGARYAHRMRIETLAAHPKGRKHHFLILEFRPAFRAVNIPPRHCSRIETHDSKKEKFPQTIFVVYRTFQRGRVFYNPLLKIY
jgi:hypothetical protein